jgi:hypothetical protein
MTLIRVFPDRTSYTPTDELAFIGDPPLFRPKADEVHVSVTFTWDKHRGERLADAWSLYYPNVKLGGVAYGMGDGDFSPGRYVKDGVTFTTRGCNNNCSWCLVRQYEGKLLEIKDFSPGYIIADNNLLQASHEHIEKVFDMLREQPKAAEFSGGIQSSLVDDWFAELLKTIRVHQLFLAADTDKALKPLEMALNKLAFLGRNKLRVYTMIGLETIEQARARLMKVWDMGGMPFAQLYQPPDEYIEYNWEWRNLARQWSRPAIMRAINKQPPQ